MLRRTVVSLNFAILISLLPPAGALAQQQTSSIAGLVKDASGAALSGVAAEASSPVLIEKVRTAVTDGQGQYKIIDLRPGVYTVTFRHAGFNTVIQERIDLPAAFTATVNAELRSGAAEETQTVIGESAVVDTQNVLQQRTASNERLTELPTSTKALSNVITVTTGMTGNPDVGGASGIYTSNAPRTNQFRGKSGVKFMYDGMRANNMANSTSYVVNQATVEATVTETGGGSAESASGGISINMVPKQGGNTTSLRASGVFTNEHLQNDNLTSELRARGLATSSKILHIYDSNVTMGGPIRRDRLWYFLATRKAGNKNQVPGLFFNKTQGTPFYTPDLDRPAYRQEWLKSVGGRLTWQATAKNKVNGFADVQPYYVRGRGENRSLETLGSCWDFWPQGLFQGSWSSPVSSKLLLEAGASYMKGPFPCPRGAELRLGGGILAVKPDDISITELSTGFIYNAAPTYSAHPYRQDRVVQRFSVSYVTGSHASKAGLYMEEGVAQSPTYVNGDVNYGFLRGVPNRITQYATPYTTKNVMKADLGLFVQDQWTIRRLTLNYGLRFDYFNSYVPAQHLSAGQFLPARDFEPVLDVPSWTDLNPRIGVSYDLLGNGRTALKASYGRYVGLQAVGIAGANNPITTSVNQVNRTWNDTNGNYVPDCDLHNPAGNGECGPFQNENFGKLNITTRYADDVIHGFGKRDYFHDFGIEAQHQLRQGVSLTAGYYRNWSNYSSTPGTLQFNPGVIDNLEVTPADYSQFCVTAPLDPRLPGGGGYQVCGLYDVSLAKLGKVNNLVARPEHYGGKKTRVNDFIGADVSGRLRSGAQLGGGVSTGRTVTDACFVVDSPQELLYCHIVTKFKDQLQLKLNGGYPLPGAFFVSATFKNEPGPPISADYNATNAEIAASLGRNLSACGTRTVCTATATVPLIAPQTLFEKRRTVVDVKVSKVFNVARGRLRANVSVYNVLNASSVLWVNSTYGPQWLKPIGNASGGGQVSAVLEGRMIQFGGDYSF